MLLTYCLMGLFTAPLYQNISLFFFTHKFIIWLKWLHNDQLPITRHTHFNQFPISLWAERVKEFYSTEGISDFTGAVGDLDQLIGFAGKAHLTFFKGWLQTGRSFLLPIKLSLSMENELRTGEAATSLPISGHYWLWASQGFFFRWILLNSLNVSIVTEQIRISQGKKSTQNYSPDICVFIKPLTWSW